MRFPTYWRYALLEYLRVLILSIATFLSMLIVMRFKEIARFTALCGSWKKTAIFTIYQFPHILPIAIPISALIASFLLSRRISQNHELTALRASGFSLKAIISPVLFASALLAVCNFSITAEIAPFCRRNSKIMLFQETSANPILLLQRQQLVRLKDAYLNIQAIEGESLAKNVTLIAFNGSCQYLNLLYARELQVCQDQLIGRDVTLVSHLNNSQINAFDTLIVENQKKMFTSAPMLSDLLKKNTPRLDANALPLKMLLYRIQVETPQMSASALAEVLRRLSLALAVFTFTLLGVSFGMENGRTPSLKGLGMTLFWSLMVLASYLTGKEFQNNPTLALITLFSPHLITWIASLLRLRRIKMGFST